MKISAQLTRDRREYNGLDAIAQELVDQPHGTRYAVVAYDVLRKTEEVAEGVLIPTVRFTHIEPVDGVQADRVREILAERYGDRTGKSIEADPTLFDVAGVPEPSAEELMAERAEAKAAAAAGVPAAAFSGGD